MRGDRFETSPYRIVGWQGNPACPAEVYKPSEDQQKKEKPDYRGGARKIVIQGQEVSSRKDVGAALMTPVSKRAGKLKRDGLASSMPPLPCLLDSYKSPTHTLLEEVLLDGRAGSGCA